MQAISLRTIRAVKYCRPAAVRSAFIAVFFLVFNTLQAQDYGLYWKYKDYDGAIAVAAPGWVAKLGSMFIDEKDGKKLIRNIRKIRVLVFQDGVNPITAKDFKRFNRKAKRRHLDELVTVRSGKTRVQVYGKMRRSSIRKVVVMFSTPDDGAGMVSLKGKFNLNELNNTLEKVGKKSKENEKPIVPQLLKVPVTKA